MKKTSKYDVVVFDLDGTLTKSDDTIIETTIHTLKEMGYENEFDKNVLRGMIGHHFREIFAELKIEINDLEEFINVFKGNYFRYIDKTLLFEGVPEILDTIRELRINTALLTTKGQDQAEKIIHHFSLNKYFDIIVGRVPGEPIKPDPYPLLKIAGNFGVLPESVLMVGDTEMDVMCASNAGADSCAVTFGYRKVEELQKLNPDFLIDNIIDLRNILV